VASTPEGKIEDYLVAQCEARGALVRKLAYIGRRGAPDRMVVWPFVDDPVDCCGYETPVDFVELKAPGKKPDPHQEREHKRLLGLGCNVFIIDSKETVDEYIAMRTGR
jgi:hypothetical protein